MTSATSARLARHAGARPASSPAIVQVANANSSTGTLSTISVSDGSV